MTTLFAGLEENRSSSANLSHCHPSLTCTLWRLIRLQAAGAPETVGFIIVVLFISFFVTFSRLCYLVDLSMLWVGFFSFSEGDGWHRRPRQRIQHGALPGSELWQTEGGQRRRRSPATETKETILAWVSFSVIPITVTKKYVFHS